MLAARTTDAARRRAALSTLCEAYWPPLYAFLRRRGSSAEDAADLTQAFFLHVIEKQSLAAADPALGRFRTFLLASAKNFVSNQWEHERAQKRGGRSVHVPFEPEDLERRYEALRRDDLDPEHLYDRHWAQTVMDRAFDRLRAQQEAAGKGREFSVLGGLLTSDVGEARGYRDLARDLGTTEVAARAAVHRLRQKFGACLRAEIAETVSDAAAADAELRHVLAISAA